MVSVYILVMIALVLILFFVLTTENIAKRRVGLNSFASTLVEPNQSAGTSNQHTDASNSSSSSSSYPLPLLSRSPLANRTWPSLTTETDLTTPELCSDNENYGDRGECDSSLDDQYQLPSTPPVLGSQKAAKGKGKQRMDADVDMDIDAPHCQQRRVASPRIRRDRELFSKRPPSSPMLLDTPRKPRPPARPLGRTTPRLTSQSKSHLWQGDEDDDPLSLSFSSPDVKVLSLTQRKEPNASKQKKRSPHPREISREAQNPLPGPASTSARGGSTNLSPRRLTLDEEMREAHTRSLLRDEDLDSGILVGVGRRNKKIGYLAHGGAGGLPVFMGDGYVDRAEGNDYEGGVNGVDGDRDSDDISDYYPKSKKSAGGTGRRGPTAAPAPALKRKNRR